MSFLFTNENLFTQTKGMVVRAGASPSGCVAAKADSTANCEKIYGFRASDVNASDQGAMIAFAPLGICRMESEPTVGLPVYLSATSDGLGNPTAPPITVFLGLCSAKEFVSGVWFAYLLPPFYLASNGVYLSAKGDMVSHDATGTVIVPLGGAQNLAPITDSTAPCGWAWKVVPGTTLQSTVYEVDFSTLANQNLSGDGVKTVDGKSCTVVNSANATTLAIVNGSGLTIRCNTNLSNIFNAERSAPFVAWKFGDIGGSVLGPPNYNEIRVWGLLGNNHVPNANWEINGTEILLVDGTGTLALANIIRNSILRGYTSSIYSGMPIYNSKGGTNQSYTPLAPAAYTYDVFMYRVFATYIEFFVGVSVGGNFPALSAMTSIGRAIRADRFGLMGTTISQDVWTSVFAYSNAGLGLSDVVFKKMKIERLYNG